MKKFLILMLIFLCLFFLGACMGLDQNGISPEPPDQLIFNSVEVTSIMPPGSLPDGGYYSLHLTDEQRGAVFPGLGSDFFANAHYLNGALRGVIGGFEDSGIEIALGEGWFYFCWGDYGFGPPRQHSNMHGVEVTAFLVNQAGRPPFLQVDFRMDNMYYRIRLLHDTSEPAQAHVSEVVEQIILGGPADFSVFDSAIPEVRNEIALDYYALIQSLAGYHRARRARLPAQNMVGVLVMYGAEEYTRLLQANYSSKIGMAQCY